MENQNKKHESRILHAVCWKEIVEWPNVLGNVLTVRHCTCAPSCVCEEDDLSARLIDDDRVSTSPGKEIVDFRGSRPMLNKASSGLLSITKNTVSQLYRKSWFVASRGSKIRTGGLCLRVQAGGGNGVEWWLLLWLLNKLGPSFFWLLWLWMIISLLYQREQDGMVSKAPSALCFELGEAFRDFGCWLCG